MNTPKENIDSGDCYIDILANYNEPQRPTMKYYVYKEDDDEKTNTKKYGLGKYSSIVVPREPLIKSNKEPPVRLIRPQWSAKMLKKDLSSSQSRLLEFFKETKRRRRGEGQLEAYKMHCESRENIAPPTLVMDWQNYHRLNVIHNFMDDLENTYPSLCSVGVIGCSTEGRDLKIVKISNSNADNCGVWIDAGIHAREWIGPAVNTYIANYIAANFKTLPNYVTNKDWYFLPVANPDGYEYSHTDNRMWRKNRACINGKCVGVDLNRNFSYGWGGRGSSAVPTHNFFRGRGPFSEPESSAIRDVLLNESISFKVYITLHSYGQVIIFPFASQDNLCPGYIRLLEGATVMSKAIYETNGNTYKVGISKDVMYRASGTSNDWSHGVVGIPYCYLIELRSRKHRFKLPSEEIEETGNEILNCMFALMEFVDSYPEEKLKAEKKKYTYMKMS